MPTKLFLGKITPLVFLCVFCLGIMAVILTGQIFNLCSWHPVLWTSFSYFQDIEVAFSCRKVWGSGRCGWQWGVTKTPCYRFSWGHSLTFPPRLSLVLCLGCPEKTPPVPVPKLELRGCASPSGVPGGRHCVRTGRPAEWAGGCRPLHPQWHRWDWAGRSGGPGGYSGSPGPPCWAPGKNSPSAQMEHLHERGEGTLSSTRMIAEPFYLARSLAWLHGPFMWIPPNTTFKNHSLDNITDFSLNLCHLSLMNSLSHG